MFFRVTILLILLSCNIAAQESIATLRTQLNSAQEDTAKVALYNKISKAYFGINNDSAVYFSNRSLTLALKIGNELYEGRARNVLALAYINSGKFEQALPELILARNIGESENDLPLQGSSNHNLGNVYRMLQSTDSAIYFYERGLTIRRMLNDSAGIASGLGGLGVCYYQKGDLKKSLDYYYMVVPIREAMHDKKGLATVYFNIALIHVDRKEKAPALEVLDKSFTLYSEIGNTQALASVCNTIGIVYVDDKNYSEGRKWYAKSLDMRIQANDSSGIAECYTNIGNIYTLEKKFDSAFVWYRRTLEYLAISDVVHQVNYLCNYAVAASALGKTDSARWAITQARGIVAIENRPDMVMSLYGTLSEYYEKSGQLDSALYFTRQYYALQDSTYRNESLKALGEMETKYETTKKQKAIDELIAEQKQKDLQILAALIGIGLLIVLGGIVIYGSIQRKKTNLLLASQNEEISIKNKDITDSINYARRIQQSVLSDENILFGNVNEAFLHYKPRDIVSGDFYWFRKEGSRLYVACADCTGHGVPGALVSVIGVNILNQILDADRAISTGAMLSHLHRMIIQALNKDINERDSKDGMDIGVLCFDSVAKTVEFSGASRPLYVFNGHILEQMKGDRFSIGGAKEVDDETGFATHEFPLVKGNKFYLSTDGFYDQFGGPNNKKFMSRQFFSLIADNAHLPLSQQLATLEKAFSKWKGNHEQVDDILVIGICV